MGKQKLKQCSRPLSSLAALWLPPPLLTPSLTPQPCLPPTVAGSTRDLTTVNPRSSKSSMLDTDPTATVDMVDTSPTTVTVTATVSLLLATVTATVTVMATVVEAPATLAPARDADTDVMDVTAADTNVALTPAHTPTEEVTTVTAESR